MRREVLPELGAIRLSELRRSDLQEFADALLVRGLSPSAIQVALLPVRVIYRRALSRGELAVNPCSGVELPAVRGRRERFASPEEAEALIEAVPENDRAAWATAMYAGLRLGELRALRVDDVDLAAGVIRVERGWDPVEGAIKLKSHAGRRKVPIAAILRDYLAEHLARIGRQGSDLILGKTAESPFARNTLERTADQAWRDAGLERLTPHGCRHTFVRALGGSTGAASSRVTATRGIVLEGLTSKARCRS
jgi:integrase